MKRLCVLLLTLLIAMPLMGATPIAYYPLDGDYLDYAGNYDMSAPVDAPVFVAGVTGQGISCSVLEPDRQYITDWATTHLNADLAGDGKDFTVAYWLNTVQYDQSGAEEWHWPTPVGAENPGQGDWWTCINSSGQMVFGCRPDNDSPALLISPQAVNDGQWHHIAVSRNNATGNVRLYVDGVIVAEDTNLVYAGNCADGDSTSVQVGGGNPGETNTQYVGKLDEVYFFDTVLTPEEVGDVMIPFGAEVTDPVDGQKNVQTPYTFTWDGVLNMDGYEIIEFNVYLGDDETIISEPNSIDPGQLASLIVPGTTVAPDVDGNGSLSLSTEDVVFGTNTRYYWNIETVVGIPDGSSYTSIKRMFSGMNSFVGPLSCPDVTIEDDVYVLPDLDTLTYPEGGADISAVIEALYPVTAVIWYEASTSDGAGTALTNGVDGYSWTSEDAGTTLTIANPAIGDMYYYCDVTTGTDGNTCTTTSAVTKLNLRKGLRHRYSFDGNVDDSISGANGVVKDATGNFHSYADGQLTLSNNNLDGSYINSNSLGGEDPNGAYVDLPNGMISDLHNWATFVIWYDVTGENRPDWQRVWDFGVPNSGIEDESTGGGDAGYIFLRPGKASGQNIMVESSGNGGGQFFTGVFEGPEVGEMCVAVVYDCVADRCYPYVNGKFVKDYDGMPTEIVLEGHGLSLARALHELNDLNNWLGRSQWGDMLFTGSYNEFRVYDVPLTSKWVEAIYEAGPDSLAANPCVVDDLADANGDCMVNLVDFAALAADWMVCGKVDGCE